MTEPLVATYSIAACDLDAGHWGVATQSKFLGVGSVVPWAEPHAGAVATQAYANPRYGPDGLALLRDGLRAEEVVERLTSADDGREHRQLGVVDAQGASASFTGGECLDWAGGRTGAGYAAQGNILVSGETVDAMAAMFEATVGTPLDERLQRRGQSARASAARPDRPTKSVDESLLLATLDFTFDFECNCAHLLVGRCHGYGDPLDHARPQVRVQARDELGGDVGWRADDEVVELPLLENVKRHLRRVAKVLVLHLVGLPGGPRLDEDMSPDVLATGDLIEHLAAIDELAELEDQHAGSLAIGEKDAEALILIEHGFELTNVRRRLDDDLTRHSHRKLDHLPQPVRRAREERQPAHTRPVEATAHVALDALQIAGDRTRAVSVQLGPRSA
jgi:hypothetical protein